MKRNNIYLLGMFFAMFFLSACEDGNIDPITYVDPGNDSEDPIVEILSPLEGARINVLEDITSVNIQFRVTDDIEVDNIKVMVDNNQIAEMEDFKDYRIVNGEVRFDNVTNGAHTVTVMATDMVGNSVSQTSSFFKEPPYEPIYANEVFYLPFNGSYTELLSLTDATVSGEPGFNSNAYLGSAAYSGADNAYLTFDLEGTNFRNQSFTVAFWYKLDGTPNRAGIITATDDEDLNQGFRFFREGGEDQRFKLNVGTGSGSVWNDGDIINIGNDNWVHIAFTFAQTGTAIYFNGELARTTQFSDSSTAVDWTNVNNITIGSGLNFNGWGHNSDRSSIDELRLFDTALTQQQIHDIYQDQVEEHNSQN